MVAFLAALTLLITSSAMSIPNEFYDVIQHKLKSEGIDEETSKCVVDELRKTKVADAVSTKLTVEEAKQILEPYFERAAAACGHSTPIYRHVSTQRIICFNLWGLCIIMAVTGFIIRSKRRNVTRQSSDDEPMLQ